MLMPIHARLGGSSLIRRSWFIEKLSPDGWWCGYQTSPRGFFQLPARECNRLRILFLNVARLVDPSAYACQKNDTPIFYPIPLLCCQIIYIYFLKKTAESISTKNKKYAHKFYPRNKKREKEYSFFFCFSERDKKYELRKINLGTR